ncbi:general transcription and DNA repair factor IIH subunit TFB4-like isoform X1 [Bidens hawaiensis]|uniref:general transcription and DNA repair factor IIH subunit TFB4-like isoform X1 n=1 Tax=Bidens hawaiensis TaxID=980011 RepID=UPI00404B6DD5
MTPVSSKQYTDDVSLLMVLIDTNPIFWSSKAAPLSFSNFLSQVISFLNSILLLNQLNQVMVIATGLNSCAYIYDSSSGPTNHRVETLLQELEEFVVKDEELSNGSNNNDSFDGIGSSLLSGSLSMALCYIQRVFRSGSLHPQPRILCMHGSQDGPGQYVAIMNSIFSAQRSMVPIDSCVIGSHHSAFLQQASYITGGVYLKPQLLDGLFQYLTTVFATDLHSRSFLQLPKPVFLSQKHNRHGIHLLCLSVYFLQASQEMFNLWVGFRSTPNKRLDIESEEKRFRLLSQIGPYFMI